MSTLTYSCLCTTRQLDWSCRSIRAFTKQTFKQNRLSVNFYLSVTVNEGTQVQSVTRFVHIVRRRTALGEGEKTRGRCHGAKWSADKIKCEDTKGVLQDQDKIIQPKTKKEESGKGKGGEGMGGGVMERSLQRPIYHLLGKRQLKGV